jgi:putative DNA primase/helicase
MVIWVVAGNNLSYTSEIQGRTIRIKIDAKTDKPEDRIFNKNLDIWVRDEHRGDLIWSVLTVIQHWISHGMPKPSVAPLGKFEEWTRVVGGVLETGGIPGFLSIRPSDNQSARDRNAAAWSEFVTKWWDQHQGKEMKVAELFEIANTVEGFYLGKVDATENARRASFGKSLNGHLGCVIATMEPEPKKPEQESLPAKLTITFTGTTRKRGGWKLVDSEQKES